MTGFASSPESGLWAEFAGPLRAFVARGVPAGIDPDDVVQDVFLRVMRHLGSVRDADRVESWLFQIARNAIDATPERRNCVSSACSAQ